MRTKRFLSVVLSAAMIAGSSVTALAATETTSPAHGTLTGKGSMEGIVDLDVFRVDVPTTPASGATDLDFIMDPQELIKATDGKRYLSTNTANTSGISVNSKSDIEMGTVYFVTSDNATGATKLSQKSKTLEIVNKSSTAVDVSVNAVINSLTGGITMTEDENFKDSVSADLYLAIEGRTDKETAAKKYSISEGDRRLVECTLEDAAFAYTKEYVSGNDGTPGTRYEYMITSANMSANAAKFHRYTFQLTGKCNTNKDVDWSSVSPTTAPTVQITYDIKTFEAKEPSLEQASYTVTAGQAVRVNYSLGTGNKAATKIKEVVFVDDSGNRNAIPTNNYDLSTAGTLKFTGPYIDTLITGNKLPRPFTIVFDNGKELVVTLQQ